MRSACAGQHQVPHRRDRIPKRRLLFGAWKLLYEHMHGSDLWEFENVWQEHVLAAARPEVLTKMHVGKTEPQALERIHWRVKTVRYEQEMRNAMLDLVMA